MHPNIQLVTKQACWHCSRFSKLRLQIGLAAARQSAVPSARSRFLFRWLPDTAILYRSLESHRTVRPGKIGQLHRQCKLGTMIPRLSLRNTVDPTCRLFTC